MTTFCLSSLIKEDNDSPSFVSAGLNSTLHRSYTIKAANDGAALILLKATAPGAALVDGVPCDAPPVYDVATINSATGRFVGTVDYRHAGRDEQNTGELVDTGDEKVSFDFTGETVHGTTAISQTKYGANAREVGVGVNVQTNGEITGFDFGSPIGSFAVETLLDAATVTNAWLKARFAQLFTLNDSIFRSLEIGDCRVVGLSGEQRSDGKWPIRYTFEVRIGEDVTDIGGISTGGSIRVAGFQYPWVMFEPATDGTLNDEIVPEAIGAYVADLQNESDFSTLGVAT